MLRALRTARASAKVGNFLRSLYQRGGEKATPDFLKGRKFKTQGERHDLKTDYTYSQAERRLKELHFTSGDIQMLADRGYPPQDVLAEVERLLDDGVTTEGYARETFEESRPELFGNEADGDALPFVGQDVFADFGFYSIPDLTEEDRKPPEFIVDGMLPIGMTFLSGAPKTRKSFLAIQLAIAVASGSTFFGLKTTPCDVAYLDLEGSKSRISYRTAQMTSAVPRNVFIANEVKDKLAGKLVERLRDLHRQRPSIRLVIIDTYSRARGSYRGGSANAYDQDVAFLEPIQRMALQENIAILFIHHDKKGAGMVGDNFERLSGTMGISGSADCVMNLITEGKRFDGKATLEFTPRDARGGEFQLAFDDRFMEWQRVTAPQSDLFGNPVCAWIIANKPEAKKEGIFVPYEFVFSQAYHTYSEKPGDIIRDQIVQNRDELFSTYGIGIQMGVKSNSNRGIRIINLA